MEPSGRSEAFQAGQSLGKFYLVRLIGEGGTSRIFKALQQPINRIVALKIPSFAPGNILSPDEFLSEATLMAKLDHPKVVRIYDFGVHEDKAFICMEYVEGWNLAEWIEARGAMSPAAVLAAGAQTLDALAHAHAHDVLHLDLSPANVLIGRNGAIKLSDFGMAGKRMRASEGRIVGTPAFLSPEHVAGAPGTRLSDLFSFGSLLYYAALGEPLFDPGPGNTRVTQAIREIEAARSRLPEDRLRRLPAPLAGIVRAALLGAGSAELSAALRTAYRAACGESDPEETLRGELGLDGAQPGYPPEEALPEGDALRDMYLRLRAGGRHREAVGLLERALRRQPDNPMLRELLALPPARQKSGAAATMEVGADAARAPGESPAASRTRARLAWAAAGSLAVTLALLAWARTGHSSARPDRTSGTPADARPQQPAASRAASPARGSDEAAPGGAPMGGPAGAGVPETAGGLPSGVPVPGRYPAPTRGPEASDGGGARAVPVAATLETGRFEREGGASPAPAGRPAAHPAARPASKLRSAARPSAAARRPPAVALSGPAGTRVSVDDTAEWIAPGPKGGWPVAPGLVNITLKPPGGGRVITSSLFVSEDTLYVLSLDGEGGFSVSRRRR